MQRVGIPIRAATYWRGVSGSAGCMVTAVLNVCEQGSRPRFVKERMSSNATEGTARNVLLVLVSSAQQLLGVSMVSTTPSSV